MLAYGRYTKSMDSVIHYDSLQSMNESKISDANWYAVAAAGLLFSITQNPYLASIISIAIGVTDVLYITVCYIVSLVTVEKFYISFFYELLKTEEEQKWIPPIYHYMFKKVEKKKDNERVTRKLIHHGSSYKKAVYYVMHLFVPFVVLIFSPSYILIKKTDLFYQIIQNIPYFLILYIFVCSIIFLGYVFVLLKIIGPMEIWLEKIYKME